MTRILTRVSHTSLAIAAALFTACGGGGSGDSQTKTSGNTPTGPTNTPPTPSIVASVTISGNLTLQAGATTVLTATPKDASGNVVTGQTVVWSSSSPTLMSVLQDGTVSATHIATVTITATIAGTSGTASVTSSLTPFTFNFNGTSAADMQTIRDGIQEAQRFYTKTFNRPIQVATVINASSTDATCLQRAGNTAYTVPAAITICTNSQGWNLMGPIMKEKIVIHESFHVLQYDTKWLGSAPPVPAVWLTEGAAELIGFSGVDDAGLLPIATGRTCNVKEWSDFNTRGNPPMPALGALETAQAWATVNGPSYDPAFLGADYLTANAVGGIGLGAFKTFWTGMAAGTQWQTVFNSAFGQTTATFYAAFPGYSNGLLASPPSSYACGGI